MRFCGAWRQGSVQVDARLEGWKVTPETIGHTDFSEIVQRAERGINDFESAGAFLRGPFFEAMVGRAIQQAIHASQSPFVNRSDAAARWRCSESEIDRAAKAGVLTKFLRNESPMYLKEQGDEAIRLGKWKK